MDLPLKGEVSFEANGAVYRLVFDITAMMALEAHYAALDQTEIASLLDAPRVTDLVHFFHAGLQRHHAELTEAQARAVFEALGTGAAIRTVKIAFLGAYDIPAEAAVPPNPPKAPAAKAGTGPSSTASGSSSGSRRRTSGARPPAS